MSSSSVITSSCSAVADSVTLSDAWALGFTYGNKVGSDFFLTAVVIVVLVIACKAIR